MEQERFKPNAGMYMHIFIYTDINISILSVCMYICISRYIYMHIYMETYIYRKREGWF
jgi:hypothetical protein